MKGTTHSISAVTRAHLSCAVAVAMPAACIPYICRCISCTLCTVNNILLMVAQATNRLTHGFWGVQEYALGGALRQYCPLRYVYSLYTP